jgi:hypothetical protein
VGGGWGEGGRDVGRGGRGGSIRGEDGLGER